MAFKNIFGRKSLEDIFDDDDDFEYDDDDRPAPSLKPEDERKVSEMKLRARAFTAYNLQKIHSIEATLNEFDREIFWLLPPLVHLNAAGLPGYIEEEERHPGVIWNFRPDDSMLSLLQRFFPRSGISPRDLRHTKSKNIIYSLSAMGSLATIAQTKKSDFDIWVCVKKEEFTEAQLDGLNQKLRAIEKWAEETNHFETHFFITDIDDARRNHFGAADKESAGSALGKLLKEEFYRTHTVLAGQAPLWRIMPPNISDEEYEGFRKLASTSYDIDTNSYADMGNAQRITLEEAFGAALWQLNKALGSPFKSAMKMALIEDYMDPASDSVLLCDHLKETLARIASKPVAKNAQGKAEAEPHTIEELAERVHVDGYVLMFNRISDYYQRKARMELLGILRKCFYLKAGTSITGLDDPLREKTPKKDMIAEIVQGWGWGNDEIADLNDYKKWPFEKSVALGKQVNGFIVDSYKRLSQSGATEKTRINPTDITVLGRKLFTFYSKKDNKIGFLPKSFEESLHQDDLTFAYVPIPNKEGIWKVYRGNISPSEIQKNGTEDQLLLKSANLPEVLVWLVINGVWSRDTSFNLIAKNVPIAVAEVQDLLSQLLGFFPPVRVDALSNEALLRESEIQKTMVLVNFGELKQGGKITRLDVTYVTSWGEIFYRRAPGDISTSSVIQFCLNYLPQRDSVGEGTFKDSLKIYLPSGRAGQSERLVFREIERLVHEAANFFFSKPLPPDSIRTYIFQDEPRVYSLTLEEKKILRNQYLNIDECFLKLPRGGFRKNHVLLSASPTKLLPHQALASHLEEGVVQVFAFDDGLLARIYVSDELGGTSAFDMPRKEWAHFQGKFFLFLESVLAELAEEPHRVQEKLPLPELVFYDITKKGTYQDHFDITNVTEAARASSIKSAHGERLTVIETAAPGEGKRILEFQTGGQSFSSAEHGGKIFQTVADHVYKKRGNKGKYTIFINAVNLPQSYRQKNCPKGAQTADFMTYKNLLETKLNEALRKIS